MNINHEFTSSSVKLLHYEPSHFDALSNYCLPREQAIFTSLPIDAVKVCEKDKDQYPVVILNDRDLIGFFVLHCGGNKYIHG